MEKLKWRVAQTLCFKKVLTGQVSSLEEEKNINLLKVDLSFSESSLEFSEPSKRGQTYQKKSMNWLEILNKALVKAGSIKICQPGKCFTNTCEEGLDTQLLYGKGLAAAPWGILTSKNSKNCQTCIQMTSFINTITFNTKFSSACVVPSLFNSISILL